MDYKKEVDQIWKDIYRGMKLPRKLKKRTKKDMFEFAKVLKEDKSWDNFDFTWLDVGVPREVF